MKARKIAELLEQERNHLEKLHQIVKESIDEEKLILNNLLNPPLQILNRGQMISDRMARFGGSWKFILIFSAILVVWILLNTIGIINLGFDPYPFIFLNLLLSCIAAFQAPIIMMSQNRQEEKDRMRSENDYLINLKAEMEVRRLHQKMDLLLEEEFKTLYETQAAQFEMLKQLNSKLDKLITNGKK